LKVKIHYKLCNEEAENEIKLNSDKSWIEFDGLRIDVDKQNIGPNSCREIAIERNWNTCNIYNKNRRQRTPLEVQLDRRVDVAGK